MASFFALFEVLRSATLPNVGKSLENFSPTAPKEPGKRGLSAHPLPGRRERDGSRCAQRGSRPSPTIVERDPRCAMISLDPETAMRNPDILGIVTKAHEGKAGVYGAVLVEGMVRAGDE